jgi:hypothetical protein
MNTVVLTARGVNSTDQGRTRQPMNTWSTCTLRARHVRPIRQEHVCVEPRTVVHGVAGLVVARVILTEREEEGARRRENSEVDAGCASINSSRAYGGTDPHLGIGHAAEQLPLGLCLDALCPRSDTARCDKWDGGRPWGTSHTYCGTATAPPFPSPFVLSRAYPVHWLR